MRYLVQPDVMAWAKQHAITVQQGLVANHGFRAEHRFWARTIACCATAGTIALKLGLIQFPPSVILNWVLEHCKRELTGYKIPKFVEFRDSLPKTPIGKILRRELRGK